MIWQPGNQAVPPMHKAGHIGNEQDVPGSRGDLNGGSHLGMQDTLGRFEKGTGPPQGRGLSRPHITKGTRGGKLRNTVSRVGNVELSPGIRLKGVLQSGGSPHVASLAKAGRHKAVNPGGRQVAAALHPNSGT